jgi:Holliday junction DNA helicase RuvA
MIGYLAGEIKKIGKDYLVIFVITAKGFGIGYKINVSEKIIDKYKVGEKLELYIHHYLTDQSEDLYGFVDIAELDLFEDLIEVSGIGPKAAQALLSSLSVTSIKDAISEGQVDVLTEAKGIGKKGAQKLIAELSDVISRKGLEGLEGDGPKSEAYQALLGLGYNQVEAKTALRMIDDEITDSEEMVKQALKNIG